MTYMPDVEAKFADVGYWKERVFIAEQFLEREKRIIRDDFALAAMQAFIGEISFESIKGGILSPKHNVIAAYAYEMADEMLKQREKL
jgi:hypothetical protein